MLFGQSVSIVTLKNAFETHLKNVKIILSKHYEGNREFAKNLVSQKFL